MPPINRKFQTRTDFVVFGGGIAGLADRAEARRQGSNAIGLGVNPLTPWYGRAKPSA